MGQRDSIKTISPPWLSDGNAERYLYAFGLGSDMLIEKMQQATFARMPGRAPDPSAIPYQAEDRALVQGVNETNAQFIARLITALDAWARAGSRVSVLEQLHAYLIGTQPNVAVTLPEMLIVGGNNAFSSWDSLMIGDPQMGAPTHRRVTPANWNWDAPAGPSGSLASVSAATSTTTTLTGLSGLNASMLYQSLVVSGAVTTSNNGSFRIMQIVSSTSAVVANPFGDPSDLNNGFLSWSVVPMDRPWRSWLVLFMHLVSSGLGGGAARVLATGGSGVPGVTSGFVTIGGLVGMNATHVQQYVTIGGAASSENNGTFQITSVTDANDVIVANPNAVAFDANNGSLTWSIGHYPFITPAPVWGAPGRTWGTSSQWGVVVDPQILISIRAILQRWKAANAYYPHIIVSFGGADGTAGSEFSPLSSIGAGNPDGTWGSYGKNVNGVWVTAKQPLSPFTSFLDGTGQYVNCTEQNIS